MNENVDTGDGIFASNAGWSFGGDVSDKIEEHFNKSIPLFEMGHDLVLQISDFFIKQNSLAYDLGCSLGSLVGALEERHRKKKVVWYGIDIESVMIEKAEAKYCDRENLSFICEDIAHIDLQANDFVVAYYSIQFIPPKFRQRLIDRIYKSLNWGGAFLWFEKVRGADARFQDLLTTLYNDYKLDQGYSPQEILSKTRSLKGILEPFSTQGNLDLLKRAGFVDVMSVMKYLCFEGFLAIK